MIPFKEQHFRKGCFKFESPCTGLKDREHVCENCSLLTKDVHFSERVLNLLAKVAHFSERF